MSTPLQRAALRPFLLALVALALVSNASADETRYFDAQLIDLARLLPPPPAEGSKAERAELDAMLRIQQRRTEERASGAKADVTAALHRFSDALGSPRPLNELSLPKVTALWENILRHHSPIIREGKKAFGRPRPYDVDKRIEPAIAKPGGDAYPSGHATWAYTTAIVLAAMVPERSIEIHARADEYAQNRVVGGVHYPSDIEAGRLTATVVAAFLFASPEFNRDFAAAAAELRSALGLPVSPACRGTLKARAIPVPCAAPAR